MTTTQMDKRPGRFLGYEYHEDIGDGLDGKSVLIPSISIPTKVTCTVDPSGTAKMQYTTSPLADVEADTAVWQNWPIGDVTVITSDSLVSPVTALRGVSVTGAVTIDIII